MKEITKEHLDNLIQKLESFNEHSNEQEIEELTNLAGLIMQLGAGATESIKRLLGINQELNVEKLNYLITNVDAKKMKIIYSSAILRYTAYYKENLPGWENLLETIYQKCLLEKINVDDILCGLKN